MININEEGLQKIIEELNKEIEELEEIQENIDKKINLLDGTHDIWQGEAQKTLYEEYYPDIKNMFPDRVRKIQDIRDFLVNVLENYKNGDKTISKDIEKNEENLDINS